MASSKEKCYALITPDNIQIHTAQLTAVEKLGGILCHLCNQIFAKKRSYDKHYSSLHKEEAGETIYSCVVCHKQLNNYPSFRNHCYLNHVVKNKFKCEHCDKSFCKQSLLNNHVASVHTYKCSSCDQKFTSKIELNTHKSTHKKSVQGKMEPPYDCFKCGKSLKSIDMCESHILEHSEVVYTCPICNDTQSCKTEATNHLSVHYEDELTNDDTKIDSSPAPFNMDTSITILGGIRCCLCDMVLPKRAELDAHFLSEHDEKAIVYTCNICGKQYEKYCLFGNHCHFHVSRDKFKCDSCLKSFPRLSLLVLHTEAFHSECSADKPYSCDRCNHAFTTRFRLRDHKMMVHQIDETDLKCTYPDCFAELSNPRDALLHRKRHAAAERWCHTCGLELASLSAAAAHLDVHRAAKHGCPVCGRTFRLPRRLLQHARDHFAALVHLCRVCGRTYTHLSRLAQHQRSHADPAARKHRCDLCPKVFDKPYELRQHKDSHAGRRPFECAACSRAFSNRSNWRKHMRRFHRLDSPPTVVDCVRRNNKEGFTDSANDDRDATPSAQSADTLLFDDESPTPAEPIPSYSLHTSPEIPYSSGTEYPPALDVLQSDDHILPHIDPLLTIKPEKMYLQNLQMADIAIQSLMEVRSQQKFNPLLSVGVESLIATNMLPDKNYMEATPKYDASSWEPPIITKVCSDSTDLNAMFIC